MAKWQTGVVVVALAGLASGVEVYGTPVRWLSLGLLIVSCTSILWSAARIAADRVVATIAHRTPPAARCPDCGAATRPQDTGQERRVAQLHG